MTVAAAEDTQVIGAIFSVLCAGILVLLGIAELRDRSRFRGIGRAPPRRV